MGELTWNVQDRKAARFRFKFEGVDSGWEQKRGDMGVNALFFDKDKNLVQQKSFTVSADSPHWNKTLDPDHLVHREERLIAPANAARLSVVITSAGPPDTDGIYIMQGLTVHGEEAGHSNLIYDMGRNIPTRGNKPDGDSIYWIRDGSHPSLAHIIHLQNSDYESDSLAIIDNDPLAHAEWHLAEPFYLQVKPKDLLTLDWNEMYSVGLANQALWTYRVPKAGAYRFLIETLDVMGTPLKRYSIRITIYTPFWMTIWFWMLCSLPLILGLVMLALQLIQMRVRTYVRKMEQEHAIERERLRIARDLHDDLGARLTHISLVSSSWKKSTSSPEDAGDTFRKISDMTRDLISSLYETVWTVDPSNDQLQALVDHIIQSTETICEAAQLQCRIQAPPLPAHCPVDSLLRHNIVLTAKEALHNAIKHSQATEITVEFEYNSSRLTVIISDNGQGFDMDVESSRNGLRNMYQRVSAINGLFKITSQIGKGTRVSITVPISSQPPSPQLLPK